MLTINCYVGFLRPILRIPHLLLQNRSITEYFAMGSMDGAGNPGLNLVIDEMSRISHCQIPADRPTTPFYLHDGLARLTQNPPYNHDIHNIGLIIADRFKPRPGLLGMMFDMGFNPAGIEPVSPYFTSVPREGCAIFTDAIRDIRPSQEDYSKEVVFTAIHELGHVFNLWHIDNPVTFMSTSQSGGPYPSRAYYFNSNQRNFLNHTDNFHVRPGGSNFEDRGISSPAMNNPFEIGPIKSDLDLNINVEQKEFWYFEPIELDVTISLKKNSETESIPDKVDPGYENFIIYITKPDGTIFKYKSPRIYCQNNAVIKIQRDKPYQRDISIFGQSGGYTFMQFGQYKVQCVFEIEPKKYIFSNIIELFVKQPIIDNTVFLKKQSFLSSKDAGLLLYHRSGFFKNEILDEIEKYSTNKKDKLLANNISYALSKYIIHKDNNLNKKEVNKLSRFTNTALDSGTLSKNKIKNLMIVKDKYNI
ncbi:MAG: hypothetical protein QM710_14405 [Flavobacterium sp.]